MLEITSFLSKKEIEILHSKDFETEYPHLLKSMNTPQFTINDLKVTARDATYWGKKEILPELKGGSTRRKYTLKQSIWIKFIQQLRAFDISLSQIRKIKQSILKPDINISDLLGNDKMKAIIEAIGEKNDNHEEIKEIINSPSFLAEMKEKSFDLFETMILHTIVFRTETNYLITHDGQSIPYIFDKHTLMCKEVPELMSIMKSPHIVLSISQAYSQLIQDWNAKKWFAETSIVKESEKKIISLLREKSIIELKIIKHGNEIDRVITVSETPLSAIENFANYIVRNGYQKIEINTRKGKPVYIQNEISLKIKDVPEAPDN